VVVPQASWITTTRGHGFSSSGASTYEGISPPAAWVRTSVTGIVVEGVCETIEEVQAASSPNILSAPVAAPSRGTVGQLSDLQEKTASIPDHDATACLAFQTLSVSSAGNKDLRFAGLSLS
jgi:hypothetical protein